MAEHLESVVYYLITFILGVIIVGGIVIAASTAIWENEEYRQWIIQTWETTADAVEDFTDNLLNVPDRRRRRQRHPVAVPAGGRPPMGSGRHPHPASNSQYQHEMKQHAEGLRRRTATVSKDDLLTPSSTGNGPSDPSAVLFDARSTHNGDHFSESNMSSTGAPTPPSSLPDSSPPSPHPPSSLQSPSGVYTPTVSDENELLEHDLADTLRAVAASHSPTMSPANPATTAGSADGVFDTPDDGRSVTTETASFVDPSEHVSDESEDDFSNGSSVRSIDSFNSSWAAPSEPSGDEGSGSGIQGGP